MIFVALPTYNGTRHNASSFVELSKDRDAVLVENACSLLAKNFNDCWVEALNMRPKVSHFVMLHSDIIPESSFLDTLLAEQKMVCAQVLSVVVPIKSNEGLTSAALETGDRWRPRRLTMTDIYERPETWTDTKLLINTGLFVADFTQSWVEKIAFTINDSIVKNIDGKFEAFVEPEDWNFSRQLHALGVSPWITRKIKVGHVGPSYYWNDKPWGRYKTDPLHEK